MKDSPELRAAIRRVSAFRELSENHLALLIAGAALEFFEPGAPLMVQGESSGFAMLILSGSVKVTADSARGAVPISTVHGPALIGELGSLAELPRSATARALTTVEALRIERAALVEAGRSTPSLLIDVIARMGERMRRVYDAINLYTNALEAFERHEFDSSLLEELRHPIPDLADFGQTFGRIADEIILRRQRDAEMASAAVIQRALLPRVREFAAQSGLDVWAAMTPARDIGGDFFDLLPLSDGRVGFGVGDVCGKGVPAALFMGITRTLIRIHLRETPDLPGAIARTNAYLVNNNAGQYFATVLYGAYDPRSGEVEYVNCGHLVGLVRRKGGTVEKLSAGGLPIGLFDQMKADVQRTLLDPGDLLLFYTDGVTEAADTSGVEFGEPRLLSLLAGDDSDAAHWVARVEAAVHEFARGQPQFDDITCLALGR